MEEEHKNKSGIWTCITQINITTKSESKIQNNLTLHMESSLTFQGRLGHYANHSHKISKEKRWEEKLREFCYSFSTLKITHQKLLKWAPIYRAIKGLKINK